MKTQILAAIGEAELQPAAALNAALAANDRVKYAFSLLQMALDHAAHPEQPISTLKSERIACGIDDPALDTVVAEARMVGRQCLVPAAERIFGGIVKDMRLMAAPVLAAKQDGVEQRLHALLAALPGSANGLLDPDVVSAMMRIGHDHSDSLHHLVMDLHKALNLLQTALAEEVLDGACVYGLDVADRPLIAAFMRGVNRTAALKFSHPGLATTATRAGDQVVIQNDIGTTDAHVIVIHVKVLSVSVTYTDVHPERLAFFQDMLTPRGVIWEAGRTALLAAGAPFFLATGRKNATDAADRDAYLDFLGSRLVFLIDWNRARKQLRGFLHGPDRIALLHWAAETNTGHRGFLELGGARLVNQAIEATSGSAMHFGDRLCDVLGNAETLSFLRFAFQAASDGRRSRQSEILIQDRIRVDLAGHFSNEVQQLLRLASDHAGLIFEMARLIRDGLQTEAHGAGKRARRAKRLEHDADQMVGEARDAVRRRPEYAIFLTLLQAADEVVDELEDAAFLLDLDTALEGKPMEGLRVLGDLLMAGAQEWIKALGHAGQIQRPGNRLDSEDFLKAIDRLAAIEHETDDADRALTAVSLKHAVDFRQLHLFNTISGRFETAADALLHASLILREYVMENVIDG